MQAHHLSSGDLIADRRAGYARMLADSSDFAAAAELMEQALELAPGWPAGWFLLGEYREKAGLAGDAVHAFAKVLELVNEDIFGASLKLAVLGERQQPDQPPVAYVEQLFDDYAGHFEEALVEKLDYKVPGRLAALISAHAGEQLGHVIDLGCGTGLLGVELQGRITALEGCDLSANMLAKAAEKRIYTHLTQADLSLGQQEPRLVSPEWPAGRADVVAAADVLMYLGDLSPAFQLAHVLLKPAGLFAFSVEALADHDGFRLQGSLRYAHARRYAEALLEQNGFELQASEELVIRMDAGAPIDGFLFISRKRPHA